MITKEGAGAATVAAAPAQTRTPDDTPVPVLDVRGVTLQYKTEDRLITATYRVDFQVFPGERFLLLGPSGCGKTTLLKGVAGFMKPTEGEIRLRGKMITGPGPGRCVVFQEFDQLLPWKTVLENVLFALTTSGRLAGEAAVERAMTYIEKVGLTNFADSYPHTLSGGMKQRVAIARAMAMEPAILLMDEPFAALDAMTRRKMQEELLELWAETRFTVLFVTHSIEEAMIIGSRVLLLSPHPGQVRAELNCHQFDHESRGGPEFKAVFDKINDLLFAERIEEEAVRAEDQKT